VLIWLFIVMEEVFFENGWDSQTCPSDCICALYAAHFEYTTRRSSRHYHNRSENGMTHVFHHSTYLVSMILSIHNSSSWGAEVPPVLFGVNQLRFRIYAR